MHTKRKKFLYRREITPYLIASMILEMMLDENLEITDKNKVKLNNKIPASDYNKKLYTIIEDMKKNELSLRIILSSICNSFSSKNLKTIVNTLKETMLKDNLISIETKKELISSKEVIKIDENKFNNIVEEIKKEFLEEGKLTEDLILLASLLNSTRFLKNFFNKYEKEKLNNRLEEIKNTEISQKVKVAQSVVNAMISIITSTIITATMPV